MVLNFIDNINNKHNIPLAKQCCCCVNLNAACYIIGCTCILIAVGILNVDISSIAACYTSIEIKLILALSKFINAILFLTSLYFIYGVVKKEETPLKVYLMVLLVLIGFHVLEVVVMLFTNYIAYPQCPSPKLFATTHIVNLVVYVYFIYIVNSYLVQMPNIPTVGEWTKARFEELKANIKKPVPGIIPTKATEKAKPGKK